MNERERKKMINSIGDRRGWHRKRAMRKKKNRKRIINERKREKAFQFSQIIRFLYSAAEAVEQGGFA